MRRQVSVAFAVLAAMAAMAAWGGNACAAPPALDVRPAVTDALIQGKWQPLLVTVENNDSGDALQGEVQVALEDTRRQERLATYTVPITLPRGAATVRVPVTVYVPQGSLPDVSVFVVSGRNGVGDIVTRRKFDKIPTLNFSLNLLAVSNAADALHTLNGARLGVFAGLSGGLRVAAVIPAVSSGGKYTPPPRSYGRSGGTAEMPVRVVNRPDPTVLPNRSAGYESLSIVYLGRDVLPDTFSDAQVDALRGWVAGGGLLVTASPKLRTDERFRQWLPLPASDTETWGRGTIAAPPFDPADASFAGSPQAVTFWRKTARAGVTNRSVTNLLSSSTSYYGAGFWSSLFRAPGLQAPGAGSIGVFLGAYLFLLVPLNYFILRRLDKREWMWATAPVLVVLFSLGAYGFGYATKGTQLLQNVATLSEMQAGSGEAVTCGGIGLFSPRRAHYDIQVNQPDAVLWTPNQDYNNYGGRSQNTEYGPLVISEGDGATGNASNPAGASARGSEISMWAMRAWGFRTSRVRLGRGIDAQLFRDALGQVTGTVANHTGKPLTRVWVSFGGRGQSVGTLPDGETRSVSFGSQPRAKNNQAVRRSYNNVTTAQLFDPTQLTDPSNYNNYYGRGKSTTDRAASSEAQRDAFRNAVASGVQSAFYDGSSNGSAVPGGPTEAYVTAFNEDPLLPITVDGQSVASGMNVNVLLVHVPLPTSK